LRNRLIILVILTLFLFSQDGLCGLDSRHGLPLFTSFTPDDYNAEGQCFDVAVTSDNLVYVANGGGVLQYNGSDWEMVSGTEGLIVVSIAADSLDRIWVGSLTEAGVIIPDKKGNIQYFSLSDVLDDDDKNSLSNVWRISATPEGVFFQTAGTLFRWNSSIDSPLDGELKKWPSEGHSFTMVSWIKGRVLVKRNHMQLEQIIDDNFVPIPAAEGLPPITPVQCEEFDDNNILITGFRGDLILLSDSTWKYFEGEVSDLVSGSFTLGCRRLDKNRFILSSAPSGLVVFDSNGHILELINKDNDILNSVKRTVQFDHSGGIWVPLDYGVTRVNLQSPFRISGPESGLSGSITDICQLHNGIYVSTVNGIFYKSLSENSNNSGQFEIIIDTEFATWSLNIIGDYIVANTVNGIIYFNKEQIPASIDNNNHNITSIAFSDDYKYIYADHELRGLHLYAFDNNNIKYIGEIPLEFDNINTVHFYNNIVWVILHDDSGVNLYSSKINNSDPMDLTFELYDLQKGVDGQIQGDPFIWHDTFIITLDLALHGYDKNLDKFVPIKDLLGINIDLNSEFAEIAVDEEERLYAVDSPYDLKRFDISSEGVLHQVDLLNQIQMRRIFAISTDPESGLVGIGGDDGRLIIYDPAADTLKPAIPKILISKVIDHNGSLLASMVKTPLINTPQLSWPVTSLRFEYSLTSYDDPERNLYEYRLIGHSDEWIGWSTENYKDFNNLHEGDYEFQVRGKDIHGNISEAARFAFVVLPPWYRTIPAIILWIVLTGSSIYGLGLYRFKYLEHQRNRLEKLVDTRTSELIEAQKAELREIEARKEFELEAQRLKTTSQLAVTISHEFNNPLAVIMGRVDLAKQKKDPTLTSKDYLTIQRQVERMRDLIIKMKKIEKIKETDYAAGLKIIDLHSQPDKHPPR
jgi:Y_Y_Y domain/His Kinase A (phospho-acceptor) domain